MQDSRRGEGERSSGPEAEAPGSLPLDAFVSPLHMQSARPKSRAHRHAAWMVVGTALATSVLVFAVAWMVRDGRRQDVPRIQRDVHVATSPRVPRAVARAGSSARTGTGALRVSGTSRAIRAGAMATPMPSPTPVNAERASKPVPEPARPRAKSRRPAVQKGAAAQRAQDARAVLPSKPTREQVIAAMRRVTPAVDACFGDSHGTIRVAITVLGATGRVTTAKVTGRGGRVGSCIARAVRQARLPKFAQRKLEISYPFVH